MSDRPLEKNDGVSRPVLFLGTDAEGLPFAVEVAALQSEQLRGTRHVSAGFFQFLEDILALRGFPDLLQTAEAFLRTVRRPPGSGDRNVACIDTDLRIQN